MDKTIHKNAFYQNGVDKANEYINSKLGVQNAMKQKWNMTLSGGDPSFKTEGSKLFEVFVGTEEEAKRRRAELERKTGKIVYLALKIPQ